MVQFTGSCVFICNILWDWYWGSVTSIKGITLERENKSIMYQSNYNL